MKIPQLVFGSTNRGSIRGYQLLGRSDEIDERIVNDFCRWAPSHGALQDTSADASSLSFFAIAADTFVIARSVYGGPEYSGRGGLQVVTIALLMERHQLAYYNSPLEVVGTALSLGHLILPRSFRSMLLPIKLTRRPLRWSCGGPDEPVEQPVVEALRLIQSGRRVVVLGVADSYQFLGQLFRQRGDHELAEFSFCTGLKPSVLRNFGIQFLSSADHVHIRQLESQGYVCLKPTASVGELAPFR